MSGVKYKGWSQQSHQKLLIYYRQSDRASLNKRYLDWDADDEQELGRQRKIGRMTQTEGATGMEALRRKWMPWLEEAKVCQHSWAWMWGSRKGGGAYRLGPWLQGLVSSSSLWSVTPNQFQRPTPHQVAEPTSKSLLGLRNFSLTPILMKDENSAWQNSEPSPQHCLKRQACVYLTTVTPTPAAPLPSSPMFCFRNQSSSHQVSWIPAWMWL